MLKKFLLPFFALLFIAMPALDVLASFDYTPMEKIPGVTTDGNFCNYISAVYKFGIWVIGICAMFMIIIGGYMYIMSAGNNASMGKAKGVIFDAIVGLLLAFFSYLILYEINPDLTQINGICGTKGGGAATGGEETTKTETEKPYGEGKECSAFTYSSWEPDQCTGSETQTRTATGLPIGCTGKAPEATSRTCNNGNTCTEFEYSPWTLCTPGSTTHSRLITSRSPDGCEGGNPITNEPCPESSPASETTSRTDLTNRSNGQISVWESSPGATKISGLKDTSINSIIAFQKEVGAPIVITGGAESSPHASGNYSHANGYKIDIDDTPVVNNYIQTNYKKTGTRSDGATLYKDPSGNTYAREGNHWDVCYNCK
ncbi:MAG TPA: hypothetical protein DIC35_03315 [Candidatus Moranbacteria bacterium]|nr:hypothetical protein [Candidatus Moranbacteria bacterium]